MKQYTLEQLNQLADYMFSIGVMGFYKDEIRKFLNLIKIGELKLLPPRDEKGKFIKVTTPPINK